MNASVGSSPARDDVVGRVCVTEFLDNFHLGYEATLCRDAEGFPWRGPKCPMFVDDSFDGLNGDHPVPHFHHDFCCKQFHGEFPSVFGDDVHHFHVRATELECLVFEPDSSG